MHLLDYVRCLHCGYEGSRIDKFLDLSLGIKAFGETVAVKSIEEALQKYIEAETLTGQNKYNCESCHGKVCRNFILLEAKLFYVFSAFL